MGDGGTAMGSSGVAMVVVVPFISAAMGLGLWAGMKRRQRRKMAAKAGDVEQHLVVRSVSPYLFLEETAPMLPTASSLTTRETQDAERNAEASGSRTARVEPFPPLVPKSPGPPEPPPKDGKRNDAAEPVKEATATAAEGSSSYPAASSSLTHESVGMTSERDGPGPEEISRAIAVLTEALRSHTVLALPISERLQVPQLIAEIERAPTYRAREPVASSSEAASGLAVPHGPSVGRAPTYRERDTPTASSYSADSGPSTIVIPQPSRAVSRAPSYREYDGPPQYQTKWRSSAGTGHGSSSSFSSSSSMRSERESGSGRTPRGPRNPRHSRLSLKR